MRDAASVSKDYIQLLKGGCIQFVVCVYVLLLECVANAVFCFLATSRGVVLWRSGFVLPEVRGFLLVL